MRQCPVHSRHTFLRGNSPPGGSIGAQVNWVAANLLSAFLLVITTASCEKSTGVVVDSIGPPPILLQSEVNPRSIDSDSIVIRGRRNPDDTLTISAVVTAQLRTTSGNPLSRVHFSLKSPTTFRTVLDGELRDNGLAPDQMKDDGLFAGEVTFQIRRVEAGIYTIEIQAEAQNGFRSNTAIAPLTIYRGNRPPVLSDLEAPDTLRLSNQTQLLTLRIRASDPDGVSDISRVIFNSYKPDNSPSGGNPFQMFDDGASGHGDLVAGDGTFSVIVTLPATTQTGTSRFEFQAFDHFDASSAILVHRITVIQ